MSTYFKGYVSSYNVEISSYFNSKLRFKYNEFAIKNKLKKSLTEFKRTQIRGNTSLSLLKKIEESDDKTKYGAYHLRSKAETITMYLTFMMYLNPFILQLHQTYKNL